MAKKKMSDMSVVELKRERDRLRSGTDDWWMFHAEWGRRAELQKAEDALALAKLNAERWALSEKAEHAEMNVHMFERCNGKLPSSEEFNVLK